LWLRPERGRSTQALQAREAERPERDQQDDSDFLHALDRDGPEAASDLVPILSPPTTRVLVCESIFKTEIVLIVSKMHPKQYRSVLFSTRA
jgi:hypothetical protein